MKANEFVEEFGLARSKELIDKAIRTYDGIGESLYFCKDGCLSIIHPSYLNSSGFLVLDLKRLVESHELVEKLGGLDEAKIYVPDGYKSERLKQAIADVESCHVD